MIYDEPGDGVNTCKTCGYKLTLLFTSTACDRCDGLLQQEAVSEAYSEGYYRERFTPGCVVEYRPAGYTYSKFVGGK